MGDRGNVRKDSGGEEEDCMGLVRVRDILKMADENRFAAAAIDVFDFQSAEWVVKAAEREQVPVLLMFYPDMSSFIPFSTMAGIAVDLAKQAIASEGLTPLSRPIRGGTDGARLSFMGLPCPNLGTGGYGFHGPYEHISVEGMQTAVRILKNIAT